MEQIIIEAIKAKKLLSFTYSGAPRVIEPHVYGVNGGVYQVLGYQIRGGSSNGGLPDWRRFDINAMRGLQIIDETFVGLRSSVSGQHSHWDRQILIVD